MTFSFMLTSERIFFFLYWALQNIIFELKRCIGGKVTVPFIIMMRIGKKGWSHNADNVQAATHLCVIQF